MDVAFEWISGTKHLTVQDNGIGMNHEDLRTELAVIGKSSKAEDLSGVIDQRGLGGRAL